MRNPLNAVSEWLRSSEKFKGFFDTGRAKRKGTTKFHLGEYTWRERCKHYDLLTQEHGMAKQSTVTIAGQLVAEGVFTEAKERDGKPYPRSEEAKRLCDDLNERIGLETMLYDTGITLAKYGSCFWEKTWSPEFDVRIIPMQEAIEPSKVNDVGEIVEWKQNLWGTQHTPTWSDREIVHHSWNVTTQSWPYGTSLLVGLEVILGTLQQLEVSAKDYMEKQAWPYEALQIGDGQYMPDDSELQTVKSKWKARQVGENIITTLPTQMHQGGTGGAPIRELSNLIDFLYNEAIDSTMIPPISRQYNATEASAKVMMPHAHATIVTPMQRIIKRRIEEEIYKPYLELHDFSVRVCPRVVFHPPDFHKEEDGEYYSKLVLAGIAPPRWAAKKLGVPEEEFDKWLEEEEKREADQFMRDKVLGAQQPNIGSKSEKPEQENRKRTEAK